MFIEYFLDLDYPGIKKGYLISNTGKVCSKKTGDVMKPFISNSGYERINLSLIEGGQRKFSVHRLVAYKFVDGFDENKVVNHIDGCKTNNNFSNLEWISRSDNNIHYYDRHMSKSMGETHHFAKYPDNLIHDICHCISLDMNIKEIMIELNLFTDFTPGYTTTREYNKWKHMIVKLRKRKFRRDITSQYNY